MVRQDEVVSVHSERGCSADHRTRQIWQRRPSTMLAECVADFRRRRHSDLRKRALVTFDLSTSVLLRSARRAAAVDDGGEHSSISCPPRMRIYNVAVSGEHVGGEIEGEGNYGGWCWLKRDARRRRSFELVACRRHFIRFRARQHALRRINFVIY